MSQTSGSSEVNSSDDVVDVVPDSIEPPEASATHSRHPPPPPRLRERVAAQRGRPIHVDVDAEPRIARDLMTREILTIGPDDPLAPLETQMEAFRFRHLPVVEGDVLVGLISHSDLLHAFSSKLSKSAPEENAIIRSLPASRIMRRELVTVRPTESLLNVALVLWESRAGCIPVTEEDGRLVGIITEGDFVRLAYHFLVTHSPTWPDTALSQIRPPSSRSSPEDDGSQATSPQASE
jgi:CBS domain-containing membrane protein